VPVVEVTNESYFPGGGANVARNLRALNVPVRILGVLGHDPAGAQLRQLLDERGVDTTGLVVERNRPTTLKTRIVAHHQQVVRFDREKTAGISAETEARLLETYAAQLDGVAAVIFEDYGKGLLSQALLDRLHRLALRRRKITAADPNSRHPLRFSKLTIITPNRAEAFAAAGRPYVEPAEDVRRDAPLLKVGEALLRQWRPRSLLITLGEHGMCLFQRGKRPQHIPTVAQEVFDVSGAGDTVIAALTAALAAGASPVEAAAISNHAAGVVVGKVGTATCSPEELLASFARNRR
jgi:D-beta-D-heptose 7-phosphate kinase/D-beta-D-heptose 1-phosphate adenosyltransferase